MTDKEHELVEAVRRAIGNAQRHDEARAAIAAAVRAWDAEHAKPVAWRYTSNLLGRPKEPTHWQPLPAPPEDKT